MLGMNCLKEYDEFGVWVEQHMRFKAAHIYFFHIVEWKKPQQSTFFLLYFSVLKWEFLIDISIAFIC